MRKVKRDRQDLLRLLMSGLGRGKMIFIKKRYHETISYRYHINDISFDYKDNLRRHIL
jgi:hypothetical protein